MTPFKHRKITDIEEKLANRIKHLQYEITTLPAYSRRLKDQKNGQIFFTVLAVSSLMGILILGAGGWLAVALLGTAFSVIVVEAGLFLSLGVGLGAKPLYESPRFLTWLSLIFIF